MKKYIIISLKVVGAVAMLIAIILIAVFCYINSSSGQKRLLRYATQLLQEKLETTVAIDSISLDFIAFDFDVFGLRVDDRQQRKLLKADRLAVSLDLKELLADKVEISSAHISGLKAELQHPKDSATNYQFIIDAFKSKKPRKAQEATTVKQQLTFDLNKLQLDDVNIVMHTVSKKKGYHMTNTLGLRRLLVIRSGSTYQTTISQLHLVTDNHQPRKNTGRPHRGWFDTGHLDVTADMALTIDHIGKDTIHVSLTRCAATDSITGFDLRQLHLEAGINKQTAYLNNVVIQQKNTMLRFDRATIQLPNKKTGRKLEYRTSLISGTTILKDVARPFAPALSRFGIPLNLKVVMSGSDSTIHFRNVHVNTDDNRLKVDALGDITHLQEKDDLFIHFKVNKMTTNAVTAKKMIDQFMVKKFMMRQLNNLGTISYTGSFDVLYKMERFRGVLSTSKGRLNFNLTLNEKTKYLSGSAQTSGFRLGQILEMKDLGDVGFKIKFSFDYSKPRTARVRHLKGGKLPIGSVNVEDATAHYKKMKFTKIYAVIKSDGVVAKGHLTQRKRLADILCEFSFNNTDSIHKMKINPGLRLKNMPWQKKGKEKKTQQQSDTKSKDKKNKKKKWLIKI